MDALRGKKPFTYHPYILWFFFLGQEASQFLTSLRIVYLNNILEELELPIRTQSGIVSEKS